MRRTVLMVLASSLACLWTTAAHAQTPLGTAFTYQGALASGDTLATGAYDMRFRLYDAASGGAQIGGTVCRDNVAINDGVFTTALDFGAVFTGDKRFLEIEVRQDTGLDCSDTSGYTVLSPRQELTATPHAAYALTAGSAATAQTANNAASLNGQSAGFYQNAANLTGTLSDTRLSSNVARLNGNQTFTGLLNFTNAGNTFTGSGAAITSLNASNISTGVLDAARMPTNWFAGGDLSGSYPNPMIAQGAVSAGKLSPSLQGVLSRLTSLTPGPTPADLIAWGWNVYQQTAVPALPAGVRYTAAAGGLYHGLALRNDGAVVAWGVNSAGQVTVPALPAGVTYVSVAAGLEHSLASRSDGSVVAWGKNDQGQTNVPALPAGVTYTAIAAGYAHSLALRSDGTVIGWGSNVVRQTNVPILPGGVTYVAIAAGSGHSLAVRSDGSVVAWGANDSGQLNVPALSPGVSYVAAAGGIGHSLALRSDGTVAAWGRNDSGQLDIPALSGGLRYTAVAAGLEHSLLLRSDGAVVACGRNVEGQTVVPALPAGQLYAAVAAGANHSLALRGAAVAPSVGSSVGLSIGSSTPPPAAGGISVSGDSSFASAVTAASFSGSGSGLTGLNASNISSGILEDSRLSANIPRLNANNTFTSLQQTVQSLRVAQGVIQKDGFTIVGTNDLGLYSQTPGGWMRFVTNSGQFVWFADSGSGTAPRMSLSSAGNLSVVGSLSKGGGSFKIDHPLDPANKYLYHSFVESPDMMNVYNGNVVTDADGFATIDLPDYFEALNRDFRYQLTVIDQSDDMDVFLWAKVLREVKDNRFVIRSSRGNLKVSWQITGIRKDAWAEKNRIPNAVDKVGDERGRYLHPEAFGKPASQGVLAVPTLPDTQASKRE